MKPLFFAIFFAVSFFCHAQDLTGSSFETLQVSYKPVSQASTMGANGAPDIKVKATIHTVLKSGLDAAAIHLKITDKQSNAVVYEVSRSFDQASFTDANGNLLYKKEDRAILINCPTVISLKPYAYELYTEDSQGVKSITYPVIK